jgi:aminoglycoside phosphotransferase family enzyme
MAWSAQDVQVKSKQERAQGAILAAFARGEMRGVMTPARPVSTYLSHVFLTGTRAFKLKRAVRCSFIDFSEIEQRRAACETEMGRNRHVGLYDRVLPVTRGGDQRFSIDGAGEIVDWVVVMRRLEETQQFDHLAARGALTMSLVTSLAERVAIEHMTAPGVVDPSQGGEYRQASDDLEQAEARVTGAMGGPRSASLTRRLKLELAHVRNSIERRRALGRNRCGQGDLHLRNLCIWNGVPTRYDAPATSQRLANSDVLYDLAFLLMDLQRLGLSACAEAVVRRYWAVTGEEEDALMLLPVFMAMRAAERMAIASEFGDCRSASAYRSLGLQILTPPAIQPASPRDVADVPLKFRGARSAKFIDEGVKT